MRVFRTRYKNTASNEWSTATQVFKDDETLIAEQEKTWDGKVKDNEDEFSQFIGVFERNFTKNSAFTASHFSSLASARSSKCVYIPHEVQEHGEQRVEHGHASLQGRRDPDRRAGEDVGREGEG